MSDHIDPDPFVEWSDELVPVGHLITPRDHRDCKTPIETLTDSLQEQVNELRMMVDAHAKAIKDMKVTFKAAAILSE